DAMEACDRGLAVDPRSAMLREERERAVAEGEDQARFEGYREAAIKEDFDAALAGYKTIRATSVYYAEAAGSLDDVKKGYVLAHVAKARAAGACDAVTAEADKALAVDAGNAEAAEVKRRCEAPAPSAPRHGAEVASGRSVAHPPAAPSAPA